MGKPIILIGGGGHCKSCIDVIEQERIYSIKGIVDLPKKKGERILGYEIIANDDDIPELTKHKISFLITMGHMKSPERRIELFEMLKTLNQHLPVIVAPDSYVSRYAKIGEGTIVMHQAIINVDALIGRNCIINNKALIEHDAVIEDHCHISTGSLINGGVRIGKGTFFGSGAVTKQCSNIPESSFIKANTIVK